MSKTERRHPNCYGVNILYLSCLDLDDLCRGRPLTALERRFLFGEGAATAEIRAAGARAAFAEAA